MLDKPFSYNDNEHANYEWVTYHHINEHLVKRDSTGPPIYGSINWTTLLSQPIFGQDPPLDNADVVHYEVAVASREKAHKLYISRDKSMTVDEPHRANDIAILETSIYLSARVEIDQLTVESFRKESVRGRERGCGV